MSVIGLARDSSLLSDGPGLDGTVSAGGSSGCESTTFPGAGEAKLGLEKLGCALGSTRSGSGAKGVSSKSGLSGHLG